MTQGHSGPTGGPQEVESLLWLPWGKQVQDWLLCVVSVGPKAGPG